jgi:DHA1 family tetracycline resistance protein-like MFS transporter
VGDGARAQLPREVWVLLVAVFLIAIGFGVVAPALPAFAASFNVGITAISMITSAFSVVRLVFAPASGRLVTAFGERSIYLWGLVIVAVSTGACGWTESYWQLLVVRSLGGIGSIMFTVSAVGLVLRMSPPTLRGRASGLWSTSFLLGTIGGPMVGGLLAGFSTRAPFAAYTVTTLLAAFVTWFFLRRSPLATAKPARDERSLTVRSAIRNRAYLAALVSAFANGWMAFGVRFSLLPLFVVAGLHQDKVVVGVALSMFAAGTASVLLISGRVADILGRRPLVLLGLGVAAIGAFGLGLAPSTPVFLTACLLAGIGSGVLNPAQTAAVADVIGTGAGGSPVLAGFQMAADFGGITGPLIAGAIADVWSYRAAFVLTGLTSALAFAVWLVAPETLMRVRSA